MLAVCVSPGGIPKIPSPEGADVSEEGLRGDGHDHEKHRRFDRAISVQDEELLDELRAKGYNVSWGTMGENLSVRGLHVQRLSPGTRLLFSGGLDLELTEMRKPCFVLDAVHPRLKEDAVGRCGFLARVVRPAPVRPGETIRILGPDARPEWP